MQTIVIQIGNSDNKLSQNDWSNFCSRITVIVKNHTSTIHFNGGSSWDSPWQNACWVCDIEEEKIAFIENALCRAKEQYLQDAIAVTIGNTEFI